MHSSSPDRVNASLTSLRAGFVSLSLCFPKWLLMFLSHSLILPVMWLWRTRVYGDAVYATLYVLHQLAFLSCFAFAIVHLDLPVASSLILLCEQVRMLMKCHSFWRETMRIKYAPQEIPSGVNPVSAHQANSPANSTLLPTFRAQLNQFLLFHFVPTLIYRNSYPRTRHIRWRFVATCTAEVLMCVLSLHPQPLGAAAIALHRTGEEPQSLNIDLQCTNKHTVRKSTATNEQLHTSYMLSFAEGLLGRMDSDAERPPTMRALSTWQLVPDDQLGAFRPDDAAGWIESGVRDEKRVRPQKLANMQERIRTALREAQDDSDGASPFQSTLLSAAPSSSAAGPTPLHNEL